MPVSNIERPREIRDILKRRILRERRRTKEEADKQRRRAEKAKALSSSKVQLEDNAKDIFELERILIDLEEQKSEQYNLLKRTLTEEDRRKHSEQTFTKEPSWTHPQMTQYPQHYLSTQQSHYVTYISPSYPPNYLTSFHNGSIINGYPIQPRT